MRVLIIAMAVLGMAQAEAAPFCASPSELKLLKAAMLEQALTAAAQSCHQNAQFGRFVAAYHSGMVQSDRALKSFFARRKAGESYEAYKARIAEEIASRSLHDGSFCTEAGRVFDIALKRKQIATPKLIATGYEHCGMPRGSSNFVQVEPALRPVKPTPVPLPVLSPAAREALALARPRQTPLPQPKPAVKLAQAPLAAQRAPAPVKSVPTTLASVRAEVAEAPDDDRVPNAYKPGAYWVDHEAQSDWPPPPRQRQPLVLGPDGRWYVVIGHHDHWTDD